MWFIRKEIKSRFVYGLFGGSKETGRATDSTNCNSFYPPHLSAPFAFCILIHAYTFLFSSFLSLFSQEALGINKPGHRKRINVRLVELGYPCMSISLKLYSVYHYYFFVHPCELFVLPPSPISFFLFCSLLSLPRNRNSHRGQHTHRSPGLV